MAWFHGSPLSGILCFEPSEARYGTREAGDGVYLTDSYSLARNRYAIGGSVYQCEINAILLDATNVDELLVVIDSIDQMLGTSRYEHPDVITLLKRVVRGHISVDALPDQLASIYGDDRVKEAVTEELAAWSGYKYHDSVQDDGRSKLAVVRDHSRVRILREIIVGSDDDEEFS